MTYRGTVKNGMVVLDDGACIPDGTEVSVHPVESSCACSGAERLSPLFRAADRAKPTGIPDLAINHDHYLYGHPRVSDG